MIHRNTILLISSTTLFIFLTIYKKRRANMKNASKHSIKEAFEKVGEAAKSVTLDDLAPTTKMVSNAAEHYYEEELKSEKTSVGIAMSTAQREEFIRVMKGLSEEEMEILVGLIPLDLCFKRIKDEIYRAKAFEKYIKDGVGLFN